MTNINKLNINGIDYAVDATTLEGSNKQAIINSARNGLATTSSLNEFLSKIDANDQTVASKTIFQRDLTINGKVMQGIDTIANGTASHAEGFQTVASGPDSHAEGTQTWTVAQAGHAEGISSIWTTNTADNIIINSSTQITVIANIGLVSKYTIFKLQYQAKPDQPIQEIYAYSLPSSTSSNYICNIIDTNIEIDGHIDLKFQITTGGCCGHFSHTEGFSTTTMGEESHAEGISSVALGQSSHAEGIDTIALGNGSHAEGSNTTAQGKYSHAEGGNTYANGIGSHAEGSETNASGNYAHAEGCATSAQAFWSHAEGNATWVIGHTGHAEGSSFIWQKRIADGIIINSSTQITVIANININEYTILKLQYQTSSDQSIKEIYAYSLPSSTSPNYVCKIINDPIEINGHIDLNFQTTVGGCCGMHSHTEGLGTLTLGNLSHAEGMSSVALGQSSHTEGANTIALGQSSHAEGTSTHAEGAGSHAEGYITSALGQESHTEGCRTSALTNWSHAEGLHTIAKEKGQHVEGIYNADNANALCIIGNGTSDVVRSNIVEVENNKVNINGDLMIFGKKQIWLTYEEIK